MKVIEAYQTEKKTELERLLGINRITINSINLIFMEVCKKDRDESYSSPCVTNAAFEIDEKEQKRETEWHKKGI